MDCGISPAEFWELSPLEIYDLMKSFYRTRKQEWKRKIQHDFIMRKVQAAYLFPEKGKDLPEPWDFYPELFEKEKQEHDLSEAVNSRHQYAAEFNRRRSGR